VIPSLSDVCRRADSWAKGFGPTASGWCATVRRSGRGEPLTDVILLGISSRRVYPIAQPIGGAARCERTVRDLSLKVNAVVYFSVISATGAVIEVENYRYALELASQTGVSDPHDRSAHLGDSRDRAVPRPVLRQSGPRHGSDALTEISRLLR
jgi:hypothetical protein